MNHRLNAAAENDRRALDIPTAALFALVTMMVLIGVPLFGYTHEAIGSQKDCRFLLLMIEGAEHVVAAATGHTKGGV